MVQTVTGQTINWTYTGDGEMWDDIRYLIDGQARACLIVSGQYLSQLVKIHGIFTTQQNGCSKLYNPHRNAERGKTKMDKINDAIEITQSLIDLACRPEGPDTQQVAALVANATATLALVELLKHYLAEMQENVEITQEREFLRQLHGRQGRK